VIGVPATLLLVGVMAVITGYLRELAVAVTFGAGPVTDAFFLSLSMPMVIMDLVIGSALVAAVVPVLARGSAAPGKASPDAAEPFCALLVAVGAASLAAGAAMLACSDFLIAILGPGLDYATRHAATRYLYWLAWLIPLNGFVVLACQTLNALRVFVLPACAALIVNLVFVLGVLVTAPLLGAPSLAVAALAGPALVSLLLLRALRQRGIPGACAPRFRSPRFRQALALAAPISATLGIGSGLGLVMISHLVLRRSGSELGDGVISALTYAFRIYQVPMTLVSATVGVLVAPALARLLGAGREGAARETCRELLNWGLLILIPVAIVLHTQADAIVRILFQYGRFDAGNARMTADVLRGFALAVPFEAVVITFLRIIQTLHRPGVSVAIGAVTVAALFASLECIPGSAGLAALPYALIPAFGLGAAACLCGVALVLHASILPSLREFAVGLVLGVGLAAALTWWESQNVSGSTPWSLAGAVMWTGSYGLLAALALPERRRAIVKLLRTRRSAH